MKDEIKEILLLDVTPLTLSIETYLGICVPVIAINTPIPTFRTLNWTSTVDNQTMMEFNLCQGEHLMAKDNRTLGRFMLDGISLVRSDKPQFVVTFNIDANGILGVRALDKRTRKEQKITIIASSGLSKTEMIKLRNEAITLTRKEPWEVRNCANNLTYLAEKTLLDNTADIPEMLKQKIEDKINCTLDAINDSNIEITGKVSSELNHILQKVLLFLLGFSIE